MRSKYYPTLTLRRSRVSRPQDTLFPSSPAVPDKENPPGFIPGSNIVSVESATIRIMKGWGAAGLRMQMGGLRSNKKRRAEGR